MILVSFFLLGCQESIIHFLPLGVDIFFFLFTLAFLSDDNPDRIQQYYLLVFSVLAFGFADFLFLLFADLTYIFPPCL